MSRSRSNTRADQARLAVLISGNGSNLQAIIDACRSGQLNAEVPLVLSNRPNAYGLQRAKAAGIDTAVIDHRDFPDRASFDEALAEQLSQADVDWIVLAGFMRILTTSFVQCFLGRLINIHPSLLPKYPGLDTHARALEAGDPDHGATVHFVTPTVDAGPAIIQGKLPIQTGETVDHLQQRVHALEHRLYPQALQWLIDGQVVYAHGQANWNGQPFRETGRMSEAGDLLPPRVD